MPPAVRQAAEQFNTAMRLHKEGKFPQAIAAYKEYLRLAVIAKLPAGTQLPAYANIARIYATQRDPKAQADTLRQATKLVPDNAALWAELANLEAGLGRTDEARQAAEQVLRFKPNQNLAASAHFTLGLIALSKNDMASAEKEFIQSAKLAPQNPQTQMNLAITYARQKKLPQAEAAALVAKRAAPKLLQPILFLAAIYRETNRFRPAVAEMANALRLDPKNPALWFEQSLLYQRMGDFNSALKGYLKVIEIQPNNTGARLNAAQIYYGIENYKAAKIHYTAASQADAKDMRSLVGIGLCEMQEAAVKGDYKARVDGYRRSEGYFKRAIQLAPNEVLPQEGLALLYERANRYAEAIEIVRKRQAKEPDEIRHYYTIARIYKAQRRAIEVLKTWKEYRARKPQDITSYAESADVLELSDKKAEAIKEWEALVAVRPKETLALLQMGRLHVLLKQNKEARPHFQKVLDIEMPKSLAGGAEQTTSETRQIEALRGLASLDREEKQFDSAIQHLIKAKALEIAMAKRNRILPNPEVLRDLANTYKAAGKKELAYKELDELATRVPQDAASLITMARMEEAEGRLDRAANVYRRLSALDKDPLKPLLEMGQLYRRNNKVEVEIAEYEKILPRYAKDVRLLGALASACELAQQDEKASNYYRRYLALQPKEIWVRSRITTILTRMKRYAEARALYEQLIEEQPGNQQFYADLAQNYVLEDRRPAFLQWVQNRLEKRPEDFTLLSVVYEETEKQKGTENALKYLNDFLTKRKASRKIQENGIDLLRNVFRFDQALALAQELVSRYPNDAIAHQNLIELLDTAGKTEDATKHLITLTQRKDFIADIRVGFVRQLGMRYAKAKDMEKALPLLFEVVKARADDYQALSIITPLLQEKGREEELIPVYGNILKHAAFPTTVQAEARKRLAGIYEKRGNKQEAIALLKAALNLTPDDAAIRESLKRLGAL
jgi:tetratricopeptide (TPR) repeat protein